MEASHLPDNVRHRVRLEIGLKSDKRRGDIPLQREDAHETWNGDEEAVRDLRERAGQPG